LTAQGVQESVWQQVTDAGLALHSEFSLGAVLRTLVERATSLTDARSSVVGVLDRSGADFEHSVGRAELLRPPWTPRTERRSMF
jgi:hypothetical protein